MAEKPLSNGMKWMLVIASGLVFIVGVQLFIFTEQTDKYFAWTVNPPLTAAFLGAAYWASCIMEFLASRQPTWTRARIAVPAVLLFTTLTFIVTMIHLDRFHLGSQFDLTTQIATWVWIAVYAIVPIAMSVLLYQQMKIQGIEAPKTRSLPVWLRMLLGIHALIMLPLGVLMFLSPETVIPAWPWLLTPLTARAIGAWSLGLGIAAAHSWWENDWERVEVATSTYVVFGFFELVAVLRYSHQVDWNKPGALIFIVFLLSALFMGLYGFYSTRQQTKQIASTSA